MLDLQYKLLKGRRVEHLGSGRTLNISSSGVLFEIEGASETQNVSPEGQVVELLMDWPLLLREICALKLVVRGRIVRRDTSRYALRIEQYEFRTAGLGSRVPLAKPAHGAN